MLLIASCPASTEYAGIMLKTGAKVCRWEGVRVKARGDQGEGNGTQAAYTD